MNHMKKAAEKTRKEYPKVEDILRDIKDIYSFAGDVDNHIQSSGCSSLY